MIAHGTVSFLKESMLERSDLFEIHVCKVCGQIATVNTDINLYKCVQCNKFNWNLLTFKFLMLINYYYKNLWV